MINLRKLCLVLLILFLFVGIVNAAYWTNSSYISGNEKTRSNTTDTVIFGKPSGYFDAHGVTSVITTCSEQPDGVIANIQGWNVEHQNSSWIQGAGYTLPGMAYDAYCYPALGVPNATYFIHGNNLGLSGLGGYRIAVIASYKLSGTENSTFDVNSTYGNLTVNVKNYETLSNVHDALVGIYDNGGLGYTTARTDSNGNVTFYFVKTNSTTENMDVFATGFNYQTNNYLLKDPVGFKQIYLIPMGVVPNSSVTRYTYNINPEEGTLNTSYIGTIGTESGGNLDNVTYYKLTDTTQGTSRPKILSTDETYYFDFLKFSNGSWFAYANTTTGGYTKYMGTSIPNGIGMKFFEGGERQIKVQIIDVYNIETDITKTVTVNGAGSYRYSAYPVDYVNGNFVSGATISVKNKQTGVWTNKTVYSVDDCLYLLTTGFYQFVASAQYYLTQDNGLTYISAPGSQQIILYPSGSTIAGDLTNSTVVLKLRDWDTLNPISGGTCTINTTSKTTSYTGATTWDLKNNTLYRVDCVANGWNSITQYFTPNANPYFLDLATKSGNNTPVVYYTSVPPTQTPVSIQTQTTLPSGFNATSGSAGECSLTPPDDLIGKLVNTLVCMGITSQQGVFYTLALLVILFCAGICAKYAGGIGAIIGAIIGYVWCLMVGWIPLWTLIAFIVVGVCLAGAKIFLGGE